MPLLAPPDEEWARTGLERLREAHPNFPWASLEKGPGAARLARLVGFSPYLTNLLVRREDLLAFFLEDPFPRPRGPRALEREIHSADPPSWRDLALLLRRIKQREILKILTLDLCGETFPRVVFALSGLAEALLRGALGWLVEHLFPALSARDIVILGMGKLAGRELNYNSDVDLVYFFRGPYQKKEQFIALFRELTRLFDSLMEGERLFRVDLRLRPGGSQGELAYSLKAGLNYYFHQSHPFERLALVKAKPSAGNLPLGKAFLKALRPVVYPRFLDYAYLDHIRDLKERLQKEAAKQGAERNIKIGPGGIREIEFFCQSLQMIYGGKYPSLRIRHTLWALARLKKLGLLPAEEAEDLRRAYVFLRTLEHRLQTIHFRQTAVLPEEEAALRRLARSMDFEEIEPFLETLESHRRRVREIFSALLEPQREVDPRREARMFLTGEISAKEAAERLNIPENLLRDLRDLARQEGPLGRRRGPIIEELIPEILTVCQEVKDPDRALAKLISFFQRLGGRISFYHALRHHPEKLKDLFLVFSQSAFLSNLLAEAPGAAEALFRLAQTRKPEEFLRHPPDEALSLLRAYKNEELFRLGLEDLRGRIELPALLSRLSDLAREVLRCTLSLAAGPNSGETPLCIFGLGKLGSRELGYRSDLDMVFIARGDLVLKTKIAQKLLHYLSMPLPEGPGYQVDTRLRPEGRKGPLVVTPEGFLTYHREDSAWWEKLALVRLDEIAGEPSLVEEVTAGIRQILAEVPLTESVRAEIRRMRELMERERTREGMINLKVGRGGLADIEFVVQWLMLEVARRAPELLTGNVLLGLERLEDLGLLSPEKARKLREGYLFLRALDQKLILLLDKPGEEKHYSPAELELCAPYLGSDVYRRFTEITRQNREIFEEVI